MLELNREQRRVLTDKLPDGANIAAGALVFGQFLSSQTFSPLAALTGAGMWVILLAVALLLAKEKQS